MKIPVQKPTEFRLNEDGKHYCKCHFCGKPYGKYTVMFGNKGVHTCNLCLLRILANTKD